MEKEKLYNYLQSQMNEVLERYNFIDETIDSISVTISRINTKIFEKKYKSSF